MSLAFIVYCIILTEQIKRAIKMCTMQDILSCQACNWKIFEVNFMYGAKMAFFSYFVMGFLRRAVLYYSPD